MNIQNVLNRKIVAPVLAGLLSLSPSIANAQAQQQKHFCGPAPDKSLAETPDFLNIDKQEFLQMQLDNPNLTHSKPEITVAQDTGYERGTSMPKVYTINGVSNWEGYAKGTTNEKGQKVLCTADYGDGLHEVQIEGTDYTGKFQFYKNDGGPMISLIPRKSSDGKTIEESLFIYDGNGIKKVTATIEKVSDGGRKALDKYTEKHETFEVLDGRKLTSALQADLNKTKLVITTIDAGNGQKSIVISINDKYYVFEPGSEGVINFDTKDAEGEGSGLTVKVKAKDGKPDVKITRTRLSSRK